MSVLPKGRRTDEIRKESLGYTKIQMQQMWRHIHSEPQEPRVPGGDTRTGHKSILFGGKRSRRRYIVWYGERKCLSLDKKNEVIVEKCDVCLELDELYWFIERKSRKETRENVYLMTMVSRHPRQIVGFDVAPDKSAWRIQSIIDRGPEAQRYCTDGYVGYLDIIYPGRHIRNMRDKSDTFTVEGVNADLRHYIPILARRSRCFPRSLETLRAVVEVFVDAYNRFGQAKYAYRQRRPNGSFPFAFVDFL